jgi:4-hydroxy-tetrahydrodipicolinate reductase
VNKVVIVGACGRMGQALLRCARRVEGIAVAGAIEAAGHPGLGRDAGLAAGVGEAGVALTDDLKTALSNADVLIDFSAHEAVPVNMRHAVELRRAVVLGTTGLNDAERAAVQRAAQLIPVVWAPNMSLGVNLLFALVEKAAGILGADYDVEIIETHHRFKKDAPSGTAIRLGEKVAAGRGQVLSSVANYGREGLVGERPRGQIGIHAVRAGDAIGDHTVMFATEGERVEISHRATSRDAFAMGALHAARWVASQRPRIYDMQDVLGLNR